MHRFFQQLIKVRLSPVLSPPPLEIPLYPRLSAIPKQYPWLVLHHSSSSPSHILSRLRSFPFHKPVITLASHSNITTNIKKEKSHRHLIHPQPTANSNSIPTLPISLRIKEHKNRVCEGGREEEGEGA